MDFDPFPCKVQIQYDWTQQIHPVPFPTYLISSFIYTGTASPVQVNNPIVLFKKNFGQGIPDNFFFWISDF